MNQFLDEIALSTKKEFVKNLCLMYKKAKTINSWATNNNSSRIISDSKVDFKPGVTKNLAQTISYFESMLQFLTSAQRQIIEREFINEESNSLWYEEYWSKSRYYQLKHEAIDRMIVYLYV